MINKKRIMVVFGTRPEAIKMAAVIKEVEKHADMLDPVIVTTGQHREMLDQVLDLFNIKPNYDLKIMEKNQTLAQITTRAMEGLEKILLREKPDMLLVQGDTTTAFVSALTAFYHKIPIGHVEAGLRTFDKYNPYPEENNRHMISVLADMHFAPTKRSVDNLLQENVAKNSIYLTGNTVIDALLDVAGRKFDLSKFGFDLPSDGKKLILVTTHRRESFGAPLKETCEALKELAMSHYKDIKIVLPMHHNPMVRETVKESLANLSNVILVDPMDYEPFVHLMKQSYLILTDSGGVQEEAPSLGKPVLVLRKTTERPEAVDAGTVRLVGTDKKKILAQAEILLKKKSEYAKMSRAINPYGDGKAAPRIVSAILHCFGFVDKRPDPFRLGEKVG